MHDDEISTWFFQLGHASMEYSVSGSYYAYCSTHSHHAHCTSLAHPKSFQLLSWLYACIQAANTVLRLSASIISIGMTISSFEVQAQSVKYYYTIPEQFKDTSSKWLQPEYDGLRSNLHSVRADSEPEQIVLK